MPTTLVHTPKIASTLLVRQSPFFAALPQTLINEMLPHFHLRTWVKGEYVNPADLMTHFYFLQSGQLEMKRHNPDTGREVTLDMLYPGDSFDIITLLDGKHHDMTLAPISDLQLISLPMELMRKWLWTYPELNKQFLPYLAHKMREQEDLSTNLVLHDLSTRLSRVILKHIDKIQSYTGAEQDEHKEHLINGLSDEALARMVGSVRQVVNKQLQHWKSQGILSKKRNQIMITDLDAIYQASDLTLSSIRKT